MFTSYFANLKIVIIYTHVASYIQYEFLSSVKLTFIVSSITERCLPQSVILIFVFHRKIT